MLKMMRMLPLRYKLLFLLGSILVACGIVTTFIITNVVSQFVKLIYANQNQSIDIEFLDKRIIFKNLNYQVAKTNIIIALISFSLGNAFFSLISMIIIIYTAECCSRFYRNKLFKKYQQLSLKNISDLKIESLITRISNDVAEFWEFLVSGATAFIKGPIMIIAGGILAFLTDRKMSISIWIAIPLISIIIISIGLAASPKIKKNQKNIEEITKVVNENVSGARTIKTFNLKNIRKNKFNETNKTWFNLQTKIYLIFGIGHPLFFFLINNLVVVIYIVIAKQIANQTIDIDSITKINIFLDYLFIVSFGILHMSMFLITLFRAKISANRVMEVFNYKVDLLDIDNQNILKNNYDIKVQNLNFKYYDTAPKYTLDNINFEISQGKTLGIIGPTGSGKSTLVNLLVNNYLYHEGSMRIGEYEINEINTQSLNDNVTIVYQDSLLYSGTIKSNMLFAKDDANEKEIDNALINACAYEFVYNFEEELEHPIKRGATNLSGGQKQRLAIARALIKNPKILILDDSTSALDNLTANKLIKNIKEKYKCTTIIVSQKISAIKNADNILVLNDGKIICQGKHQDLLKTCQLYKDIYQNQLEQ